MGSKLPASRQVTELVGLSQTTLKRLGQRPSTPTDFGGEDSTGSADLRLLKRCLVNLATHDVLRWEVVEAVFQLIPELKGA